MARAQSSQHQNFSDSVVYVEERRHKYGSLGKTVLQDTLSADLFAEEYPNVSLADMAGDESDCCSALGGF